MTRVRAALTHFGISVLVFSLFLSLVFFIWYPWPFNYTQGIAEIVYLMAGVDVVLGPLLTLIVYKAGKKSLKFDLSVIAAVQIAALIYGGLVIYKERPAYIVFNMGMIDVVTIDEVDISQSDIQRKSVKFFEAPFFIYAEKPEGKELKDLLVAVLDEKSPGLGRSPKYYRDYKKNKLNIIRETKPVRELHLDVGPVDMIEHINFAPVVGKRRNIIALLDNRTGEVIEYRLVDPWAKQ